VAGMIMLLPIVTITIFEVILIWRESAHGLGGTVSLQCQDDRLPASRLPRKTRTDANAAGATNRCNPRFFEERNVHWMGNHRIRDCVPGVFYTV